MSRDVENRVLTRTSLVDEMSKISTAATRRIAIQFPTPCFLLNQTPETCTIRKVQTQEYFFRCLLFGRSRMFGAIYSIVSSSAINNPGFLATAESAGPRYEFECNCTRKSPCPLTIVCIDAFPSHVCCVIPSSVARPLSRILFH